MNNVFVSTPYKMHGCEITAEQGICSRYAAWYCYPNGNLTVKIALCDEHKRQVEEESTEHQAAAAPVIDSEDTRRYHERQKTFLLTCGLPYIIHPDYPRLVRLARIWWREIYHHQRYSESLEMLARQCEALHYRIYRQAMTYRNVPVWL